MEHIFLVDPIGKLPEKPVCLKRLSSLTGWDFSTGLFRSIHILLGLPSSSRPCTIYFRVFSDLTGNGKRVLRTGFSNRNFCVPFAQFETRWVFDVNGKQPISQILTFAFLLPLVFFIFLTALMTVWFIYYNNPLTLVY